MRILIDADSCPVVDIAVLAAKENNLDCIILCDTSHVFEKEGAQTITVSKGADSVDFALVNMIQNGDIVITQDYGLAAMCLAKKAITVSQDGRIYDDNNIDSLLFARHHSRKVRNAGGRTKGPSKRTPCQDEKFEQTLLSLIEQKQE